MEVQWEEKELKAEREGSKDVIVLMLLATWLAVAPPLVIWLWRWAL